MTKRTMCVCSFTTSALFAFGLSTLPQMKKEQKTIMLILDIANEAGHVFEPCKMHKVLLLWLDKPFVTAKKQCCER